MHRDTWQRERSCRQFRWADVRLARKALCDQMTSMFLQQWNQHAHVCENFNPHKIGTDCTGTKFYHWGALAGMISIEEEGLY